MKLTRRMISILIIATLIIQMISPAFASISLVNSSESSLSLSEMIIDESNNVIYAVSSDNDAMYTIDPDTLEVIDTLQFTTGAAPTDIDMYDGDLFIPLSGTSQITVVDTAVSTTSAAITVNTTEAAYRLAVDANNYYIAPYNELYCYAIDRADETLTKLSGSIRRADIVVDEANNLIYFGTSGSSGSKFLVYDSTTLALLETGSSPDGGGFVSPDRKIVVDGDDVFYAEYKFNKNDISEIYGNYVGGNYIESVLDVNNDIVVTNTSVYTRDTFELIEDFDSSVDLAIVASDNTIYTYGSNTLKKYDALSTLGKDSRISDLPNGIYTGDLTISDWVYDATRDVVYGISSNYNTLFKINPNTMTIENELYVGSLPMKMHLDGNDMYISLFGSTSIAKVDLNTHTLAATYKVSRFPYSLVVYGDKIIYTQEDQHCETYEYDMTNAIETKLYINSDYTYYQHELKLDKVNEILYLSESGSSSSDILAIDANDYSVLATYTNARYSDRISFLEDNFFYAENVKLEHDLVNGIFSVVADYGGNVLYVKGENVFAEGSYGEMSYFQSGIATGLTVDQPNNIIMDGNNLIYLEYDNIIEIYDSIAQLEMGKVSNLSTNVNIQNSVLELSFNEMTGAEQYNIYIENITDSANPLLLSTTSGTAISIALSYDDENVYFDGNAYPYANKVYDDRYYIGDYFKGDTITLTQPVDFTVTYTQSGIESFHSIPDYIWTMFIGTMLGDNSKLSDIELSTGSFTETFDSNITDYTVILPFETTDISFTPVTEDSLATVEIDYEAVASSYPLSVGSNNYTIRVDAENSSDYTRYYVNVIREADVSEPTEPTDPITEGELDYIVIDGFEYDATSYYMQVDVDYNITEVLINSFASASTDVIYMGGMKTDSFTISDLDYGYNDIIIIVESEDGNIVNIYELTIFRPSSAALIKNLLFEYEYINDFIEDIYPELNYDTYNYSMTLDYYTTSIDVNITPMIIGSEVYIDGVLGETKTVELENLNNIIEVLINAPNGDRSTYQFVINRDFAAQNSNLSILSLSTGTLTPEFDPNVVEYDVTVPYSADIIDVMYWTENPNAAVDIAGWLTEELALAPLVGLNEYKFYVVDEYEAVKVYTINLTRASATGDTGGNTPSTSPKPRPTTTPDIPEDVIVEVIVDELTVISTSLESDTLTPDEAYEIIDEINSVIETALDEVNEVGTTITQDGDKTIVTVDDVRNELDNMLETHQEILDALLGEAISQFIEDIDLSISVPVKDIDNSEVTIDSDTLTQLSEKEVGIKIVSEDLSFELPDGFAEIDTSKELTVTMSTYTEAIETDEDLEIVGDVYDLDILSDGEKVTDFEKLPVLEFDVSDYPNPEILNIYVYNDESGEWEYIKTELKDGKLIVHAPHFSKYAVLEIKKEFTDVNNEWFSSFVMEALKRQLVSGFGDGTFRPNNSITKAEITQLFVGMLDLEDAQTSNFDFGNDMWYFNVANNAYDLGLIYDIENFEPDALATRNDIVYIAAKVYEKIYGSQLDITHAKFEDYSEIETEIKECVDLAVAKGIISGYPDNTFKGNNSATRAEAISILIALLNQ